MEVFKIKNIRGVLEFSILFILVFLLSSLLSTIINIRIAYIIFGFITIAIGVLMKKENNFYERLIKLLYSKESYNIYINYIGTVQEEIKYTHGNCFIIIGVFILLDVFKYPLVKSLYNIDLLYKIGITFLLLLNSIIGVYLYKKFKSDKQYIISIVFMIAIYNLLLFYN